MEPEGFDVNSHSGAAGRPSVPRTDIAERALRPADDRTASYAALDLGTNNCRLLVAAPDGDGFRVLDAFSRIVRLGEGLSATGRLSEPAMDRAIGALAVCAEKIGAARVRAARYIATEACRAASNGEAFLERVRRETGLDLEIVDRGTEARLAVQGCEPLIAVDADAAILFDIGGGSTEIALVTGAPDARRIVTWTSLPVGVVSLSERHGGRHVTPELFQAMVDDVAGMISAFDERHLMHDAARRPGFHLLGTSGTVTTVAGVHLGLKRYDRRRVDGLWMHEGDIGDVIEELLGLDYADRVAHACIGPDRADLVLAGCAIFEAIRQEFPARRLRIADRGLREGILVELMRADGAIGADPSAPGLRPGERRRRRRKRVGHGGGGA